MRVVVRCAVLFALSVVLSAGNVFAGDFSADMVSRAREGSFTAKIYVSGDKSRIEMAEAVSISRMDKKVVWVLMPQQNMYIEQPLDLRSAASIKEKVDGETERKAIGSEKINNRDTTKYLVTFTLQGKSESVYQWIDEAEHIPVKTAAVDGSWSSEFKNIRTGRQDQALFEVPSGYQKMSFDMGSMKDMMGSIN